MLIKSQNLRYEKPMLIPFYKRILSFNGKHRQKPPITTLLALLVCWMMISTPLVAANDDLGDHQQVINSIEKLNWITEEYPPFNYKDPKTGEITGVAVEVLSHIFSKIGIPSGNIKLKIYPWARGYHKVLNDPGTALFSTTYTADRLQKMKFVGPVVPNIVAVIAAKSRHLSIGLPKELNRLKIGVVRDDIGEQLLISQGVDPDAIDQLNSGLSMVKKLASGRIDAVAYAHATTLLLFKMANINSDDFEIIHILKESTMGYAFHHSTDAIVLEPIRNALDQLIIEGTLQKILTKYDLKATNEKI